LKVKRGTVALIGLGPQFATMRVDDGLADCQAKAKTVWLGCVKSLEYFLFIALEAVPVVLDGKPEPASLVDTYQG
jgi:hypothetical protein